MSKSPYTFKDIDHYQADPHSGVPRSPVYKPYPNPVSPPSSRDPEDPQGPYVMTELWCVTLWEARANLIAKHGFSVGNNLILRLVTDGMKLGPKDPNFLQARDAILLADRVYSGGANLKALWSAFAKRGMGSSATCPSSLWQYFEEGYRPVEAFDLPPEGTQAWVYPSSGGLSGGVYSSPAVGPDGTIYFGTSFTDKKLYAVNPDGTFKWSHPGLASFYCSPALGSDGTIYVGNYDSLLYALNPDGSCRWTYDTSGEIFSSPAVGPDGTIYFGAVDSRVYALYPNGGLKWSRLTGNTVYSSPTIGPDGTIFIGSMDGKVYALDPANGANRSGWPYTTGSSVYSSPAVDADGTIYVGSYDRKVYALNPNGTKKWEYLTGDAVRSSPAIGPDGTIYVGSLDAKVYALNPASGALKAGWPYNTGGAVYSSPAVAADGTIFVGSDYGRIYALNPDGTPKGNPWPFVTGTAFFSSPVLGTDGTVYVGCNNGRLYAIKNPIGLAQSPSPMFRRNPGHTAYDWFPVGVGVQAGKSVFALSGGAGSVLYAGGNFLLAGNLLANRIAQWNGTSWSALGNGVSDGYVAATAVSGNDLYVGGVFTYAGGVPGPNIGRRTGTTWTTLLGPNGPVYAVAVAGNGDVYIGGWFTSVNATPANNIARFRSGVWQALSSGGVNGVNGPVQAIAVDSLGQVYVGGAFSSAGAASCANIARWVEPVWSALGYGTDAAVAALTIGNNGLDVYAGGYFEEVHNGVSWIAANGIAKWASGAWSALGVGVEDLQQVEPGQWVPVPAHVNALAIGGSTLYAGGDFTLAGGQPASRVAAWNGTSWTPLGSGVNNVVEAIALTSDSIYAGGGFTSAGGTPASAIARWKK
jgi:outer membrane protein assembly factor BamB